MWYRAHCQTFGWLGWARDGQAAGTAGQSKRSEAIEVQVLPKGQVPEGYRRSRPPTWAPSAPTFTCRARAGRARAPRSSSAPPDRPAGSRP
ncbi:MAG: hypothetical protein IKG22_03970 [Atopobiaceae bacterium]|nr:hypothetical protein [Atopobiaceae bacterium]